MASIIPNKFTSYNLTDKERIAGGILTIDQKLVIQTQLSEVAEQILSLEYTPSSPLEFVKQDAFLKGQLQTLEWLLTQSDACEKQLLSNAQTQSE